MCDLIVEAIIRCINTDKKIHVWLYLHVNNNSDIHLFDYLLLDYSRNRFFTYSFDYDIQTKVIYYGDCSDC